MEEFQDVFLYNNKETRSVMRPKAITITMRMCKKTTAAINTCGWEIKAKTPSLIQTLRNFYFQYYLLTEASAGTVY